MRKVEEYLRHAECRDMARTAFPANRLLLEQMCETWDQLAKAEQQLEKLSENPGGLTITFELIGFSSEGMSQPPTGERRSRRCPLSLQKRTCAVQLGMSAKCQ